MHNILSRKCETEYFDTSKPDSYVQLGDCIIKYMSNFNLKDMTPVILCIGTDRATGDCLGPLVGEQLFNYNHNYMVFGNLSSPVHALNIRETIFQIKNTLRNLAFVLSTIYTIIWLLYSLGVPNIGVANAKVISRYFDYDMDKITKATADELVSVEGVGDVMAKAYVEYFSDQDNMAALKNLLDEIQLEVPEKVAVDMDNPVAGKTFVITGSVNHFENRNQVKDLIESLGGKVTGSVTAKTDYLINNDNMSTSSKNKKAKELGIPIITEEEFIQMTGIEI